MRAFLLAVGLAGGATQAAALGFETEAELLAHVERARQAAVARLAVLAPADLIGSTPEAAAEIMAKVPAAAASLAAPRFRWSGGSCVYPVLDGAHEPVPGQFELSLTDCRTSAMTLRSMTEMLLAAAVNDIYSNHWFGAAVLETWRSPEEEAWMPLPEAGKPSPRHAALVASDPATGRIFVWGGMHWPNDGSSAPVALGDGALYDPAVDAWRPITMNGAPSPRGYGAVTFVDGRFWLHGGAGGEFFFESPLLHDGAIYDPATDTWEAWQAPPASARTMHTLVDLGGGRMLIVGGSSNTCYREEYGARAFLYEAGSGAWWTLDGEDVPLPVGVAKVGTVGNRTVLWEAGCSPLGVDQGRASRPRFVSYDPDANEWQPFGPAGGPGASWNHISATTAMSGNQLYFFAGQRPTLEEPLTYGASLDLATGTWNALPFHPSVGAVGDGSALFVDGRRLRVFGVGRRNDLLGWRDERDRNLFGTFDLASATWSLEAMPPVSYHEQQQYFALPDGGVVALGMSSGRFVGWRLRGGR